MPPKAKHTREKILHSSLALVRQGGWGALSARSLAREIGASTIPIYSAFSSMQELSQEIVRQTIELQRRFMMKSYTSDPWHNHGIGYVLFAMEEPKLFLSINDDRYFELGKLYGQDTWDECVIQLISYSPFAGLNEEQLHDVQLKRWMLVHGLAFHCCFAPKGTVDKERIIAHVRNGSNAILYGLKEQYRSSKEPSTKQTY